MEEVKNASGLYNLMRNLGGAIGLAVANTLILYLNKTHYSQLRESVKSTDIPVQNLLFDMEQQLDTSIIDNPNQLYSYDITAGNLFKDFDFNVEPDFPDNEQILKII